MQSLLLCVTYFKDEDATIYPEELQPIVRGINAWKYVITCESPRPGTWLTCQSACLDINKRQRPRPHVCTPSINTSRGACVCSCAAAQEEEIN